MHEKIVLWIFCGVMAALAALFVIGSVMLPMFAKVAETLAP